jgi:hypothetical protein
MCSKLRRGPCVDGAVQQLMDLQQEVGDMGPRRKLGFVSLVRSTLQADVGP